MQNDSHRIETGLPKCVTGKNPYGLCSCCRADGMVCCAGCSNKDDCNIVCGYIHEQKEGE